LICEQAKSLQFEIDMLTLDRLDELSQFDALLHKVGEDIGQLVRREDKLGDEGIELGGCSKSEMLILRKAEGWIRALRVKSEMGSA